AFVRGKVSLMNCRFCEYGPGREEFGDSHELCSGMRSEKCFKRPSPEKSFPHWRRPFLDQRQSRPMLKGEADELIRDRGREQLLGRFPERLEIHRCVQIEQIFFDCRINN